MKKRGSVTTFAVAAALSAALSAGGCSADERATADPTFGTRLAKADQAFRNRQYEDAGTAYESLAEDAFANGDTTAYVEACAMRARSYLILDRADEGRPWLDMAGALADTSMPLGWSRYLAARGRFERSGGDLETALGTFLEMFDFCAAHGLHERAVDAAHMLALTGDPGEKDEWSLRGIEMAEKGGMTGWLGPLWNNLGWDYVSAGRYGEARAALEKAREYHYAGTSELPKLIADYSVAHVIRLEGRLDESEAAMRAVFDRASQLSDEGFVDGMEWMGLSRWELGEIAISRGEAGFGLGMLRRALGELEQAGMPSWDAEDWERRTARVEELERT